MSRVPSRLGLVAIVPVLGLAFAGGAEAQRAQIPDAFAVRQQFPDLAFPALDDGRPTSIADFRGRKLILHVFASW